MMPTVELKAPPGQFRVVAVDTFDGTDWVHGDFATAEEALRAARSKGGNMQVFEGANGGLIKAWIDGVAVEDQARKQLDNMASMPFIHKHVAIMPDCHWGMGATVGSVIPTKGAIIPAAVGVDIGCGMMARRTSLTASDLPDNLHALRTAIEQRIPHGRTDNGGANDRARTWR
jgi:hypothetical protein